MEEVETAGQVRGEGIEQGKCGEGQGVGQQRLSPLHSYATSQYKKANNIDALE